MKDGWKILVTLFAGVVLIPAIFIACLISCSPLTTEPEQPAFGYTGEWQFTNPLGVTERPLPPANELWKDFQSWKTERDGETRLYRARLGGIGTQSNFQTWVSSGDTPLGAQHYTNVEFIYQDSTNGPYIMAWSLRGRHNIDFLKFDFSNQFYQLQPVGNSEDFPPRLAIVAIEGMKPEGR